MSSTEPAPRPHPIAPTADTQVAGRRRTAESLGPLYEGHRAPLLRYLEALTRSREDAKEIYHDACAKLISLDALDTVALPERYLWRTAHNLARDRKRERAVRIRLNPIALFNTTNHSPAADSCLETRQRLALVERAIGELTPKCRRAFLLRIFEELSFEQIAQQMQISTRMAKYHVPHAVEHCQRVIREEETPHPHGEPNASRNGIPGSADARGGPLPVWIAGRRNRRT